MKILLIVNKNPFPPKAGYSIVIYNTIEELVSNGCEVTLFCLTSGKPETKIKEIKDPLFGKIHFLQYKLGKKVTLKDTFKNFFKSDSYNLKKLYEEGCSKKIIHLLKSHQFDVIQLEGLFVVPYLDTIRAYSGAPIVYRAHNIEYQIWKRLSSNESSFFKKLYWRFLSKQLQKQEHKVLNSFDKIVSLSTVDEHFFKSIGCKTPIQTIPVSINLNLYDRPAPLLPHKSIGYIGTLDWRPNIEGLNWFIDKVWPSIQQLDSGIKFHLAGKNIPQYYYNLKDDSFIVEGEVDDALEFIAKQHVFIVPLLSGSGMRVKIIEAMALGKCVIATSIAAEGIHYLHDKNILIADKADEFYRQILRCFTDQNLVKRIGQQARKLVERYHHNEKCSRSLLQIYSEICDKKQ